MLHLDQGGSIRNVIPLASTIPVVGWSSNRPNTEQRAGAPATETS
jgi:hypothetical protein